jgi:N-acetylmuramoyl-L-alanine amidase
VLSDYLFNLATTSHVADWLRRRGARVHLFQYTQQTGPSIEDKGYRGRGSHVFLSVHHNGANRRAQGSEVFVHSSLASAPDRRLAFNIQDQLVARVWNGNGAFDRGVKAADFAILRGAAPVTGAAVLVEAFFIDTPESLVTFNSWMGPSARAIADGVSRYWITRTQF